MVSTVYLLTVINWDDACPLELLVTNNNINMVITYFFKGSHEFKIFYCKYAYAA